MNHDDQVVLEQIEQVGSLIDEAQRAADPVAQERLTQIVQAFMQFHAAGLRRMLDRLLAETSDGQALIDTLAEDPLISNLLLLHDLHPLALESRVRQALEKVRPYLAQHHGNVEYLALEESGVLQIRLLGNCHGCPSSRVTLKNLIEEAIFAAAPEVTEIRVEETPAPESQTGFVPLSAIQYNGCPHTAAEVA